MALCSLLFTFSLLKMECMSLRSWPQPPLLEQGMVPALLLQKPNPLLPRATRFEPNVFDTQGLAAAVFEQLLDWLVNGGGHLAIV